MFAGSGEMTPRTQKITSRSGSGSGARWQPWVAVSARSRVGYRYGVANLNCINANQYFLHDQTKDFLPLQGIQSFGSDTEFATKPG
jgi:hypothetical protein